jgi:hypothetical protein
MADQRRYTQDQINAALASGEGVRPNDKSWLSTLIKPYVPEAVGNYLHGQEDWYRKVGAGGINSFPQMLQAPEFLWNVGGGAYDYATSKDPKATYGESVFKRSVGGDAGVKKLQDYMQTELAKYTQELPEHQRNDPAVLAKLQSAIQGSEGYNRLKEAQSGTLNQLSIKAQDFVRDKMSINPTYSMSSTDNLADFIGGALVPTPSKVLKAIEGAPTALKVAGRVAEWLLPGSSSAGNAAFNVAAPLAIDQTLRTVSGAPNYAAGTSDLPQELMAEAQDSQGKGDRLQPQPQPQLRPRHIPGVEDASASSPFSLVSQAAAAEAPAWTPPFKYGLPQQQKPAQPVQLPQDPPQYPDKDKDGGGGGSGWAWAAGITAGAALLGATLRGKVPAGLASRVIQDVDSPAAAARMQPTATPNIPLNKGMPDVDLMHVDPRRWSGGQRIETGLNKTAAIKNVVKNALDPNDPATQDKLNKINREVGTASPLEVANAAQRTYETGELPLMTRNTLSLNNIRKFRDAGLDAAEQEQLQKRMVLGDRMDGFNRTNNDRAAALGALRQKLANTTAPQARRNLIAQIQPLEAEHRAATGPNAMMPHENGLSVRDVNALIAAADANPKIRNIVRGVEQILQDVEESAVALGRKTRAEVTERRQTRPNYVPTSKDTLAKETGISGFAKRVGRTLTGRKEKEEMGALAHPMYEGKRGAIHSSKRAAAAPHDELHDVLNSLETHIHNFHREVRADRAAQTATELVLGTNDWGRSIQRAHPPVTTREFENPGKKLGEILRDKHVYTYNADGLVHIMRAHDYELARAMRHNPSSTVGVMDNLRRWMQMTYTRDMLAPWFALKAGENELAVARIMLDRNKYSVGWIDRMMKDVFPPMGHLNKLFEYYPDPSFRLQHLAAIGELAYGKSINKLANMLGNRMMQQSQLMHLLGPVTSNKVAQAMIRTTNDIRTRITFMEKQNILTVDHVVHSNERIWDNWKAAKQMLDATPKPVRATIRNAFELYLGASDVIRNSAKYAIAGQNLDRLLQKHNGNIPNDVMRGYVKDMRYMGGDMSKAIGSPALANLASIAPYGANSINSYMHIFEGLAHNKTYVGSKILTHMVLPKVFWTTALVGYMGKEFVDWYYGDMPTWQRQTTVPMLSPSYLLEIATGEFRKPTTDDLVLMHQAPESVLIAETVMNGLQAAGWFDVHKTGMPGVQPSNNSAWSDQMHALAQIGNFGLPIADLMTVFSKDAKDNFSQGLSTPSEGATMFKDMMSAVFSGSMDVAAAGYSAATDSLYRGKGIADAMEQAISYAVETAKQKYPETPLSPLFGGQRRHYTKGATRERNTEKFDAIKNITKQRGYQRDAGENPAGMEMPLTHDPDAQRMLEELHSTANAHVMLTLRKQRADLYDQINYLDANTGKIAASDYTKQTEDLKKKINAIDRQEEEVFQRLEMRLANHWGRIGVTDVDSAVAYIQSTLTP